MAWVYVCIVAIAIIIMWKWFDIKMWWNLHFRRSEWIQVDDGDVEDLLEEFGKYLTKTETKLKGVALSTHYNDKLGHTAIIKVRWPNTEFYYVKEHWLDLLDSLDSEVVVDTEPKDSILR